MDGKCARNGLGVCLECSLTIVQLLIVFIGQVYGACFCAIAAGSAFGVVDKTGGLMDLDFEISFVSADVFNVGTGMEFDIDMPADLDQFGRDNSHGTVIGGKGLV